MSWSPKSFIRSLDQAFYQIERQFRFLQRIDKTVLNSETTAEIHVDEKSLVIPLIDEMKQICLADEAALILFNGSDYYFHQIDDGESTIIDQCPSWARQLVKKTSQQNVGLIRNKIENRLSIGVAINIDNVRYATMALSTTRIDARNSPLIDNETQRFLQQVGHQLSILTSSIFHKRLDRMRLSVAAALFKENVDPGEALGSALEKILEYMPKLHSIHKGRPPLIQLLSFKSAVDHLTILAAVGGESVEDRKVWMTDIGKPVLTSDSICGLLLDRSRQDGVDFLLTDPAKEYPNLYKAFAGSTIPHSELVVAVKNNGCVTAVLNFEHQSPDVFGELHIKYASETAAFLSPLIESTLNTMDEMREREASILYTMDGFLVRLNSMFVHKTAQKVPLVYNKLFNLAEDLKGTSLEKNARDAYKIFEEFQTLTNEFMHRAPQYIRKKSTDIIAAIKSAVKEFDSKKLDENNKTVITLHFPERAMHVYASLLLQEHIYNLISNALDAVSHRIELSTPPWLEGERGAIVISVAEKKMRDDKGMPIPGTRIVVRITDNGCGIPEENIMKITQYRFTTKKHGTGYGLPAAKDYIHSFGGGFDIGNRNDGCGAYVEFFLDEFDSKIHREDQTMKGQ